MTSSRLPGKVMLPLCGKPVLQVMLERLECFKDNIIIATTDDGTEQPIVELCQRLNVRYFHGDTNNVLKRYYDTAIEFNVKDEDTIVRLTSDCPLIDPFVIQSSIEYFNNNQFDYVAAGAATGFPRGMDTEVFSFHLLKEAFFNATEDYEKEHVTPYIYKTCGHQLALGQFQNSNEHSRYRLTLDEDLDYKVIQEIYNQMHCRTDFSYNEMINLLIKNPYICEINAQVEQKKLDTTH